MRFKGKSALVCGAGGGIGLATARGLLSAGLDVALADIKDEPQGLADGPGQASYYQGDLSNENFVRSVVEQTASSQGGIDYLVNTTGVLWFGRDASVTEMDMDLWDQVFAVNLKSFALTGQARHRLTWRRLCLPSQANAIYEFDLSQDLWWHFDPEQSPTP